MDSRILSLQTAHQTLLHPALGFLPPRVPATELPPPFQRFLDVARALPPHYHGAGKSVRPWLEQHFSHVEPDVLAALPSLLPHQLDTLMTVLSVLNHAYRWDCTPPTRAAYELTHIDLPPGLVAPWQELARLLGQPCVGNLYCMVLSNWTLPGKKGGDTYTVDDLLAGTYAPLVSWLMPPDVGALQCFLATGLETEALGAQVVQTCLELLVAADQRQVPRSIFLLERLRTELHALGEPFKTHVRRAKMPFDSFLTLIQPTTIWGLDHGDGPLEGASGPQVGAIQCLDATLGVPRLSSMGHAILESRKFMPARHRQFLAQMDACAGLLRDFVLRQGDPRLTGEFNGCLTALRNWRLVHKARGAQYLKPSDGHAPAGYASTGGVVALDSDRVATFEQSMDGRVADMAQAAVTVPEQDEALEALHRYLWPEDRLHLRQVGTLRSFAAGQRILAAGSRRAGLWLIDSGAVEVHVQEVLPLTLEVGQMFGEMSFVENAPASADVVAHTDCTLLFVTPEHIFSLVDREPSFGARFYQFLAALLSRRLRDMNQRVASVIPSGAVDQ